MADELEKKQQSAVATKQSRRGHENPPDESELILPRVMLVQNTPPRTVKIDRKICPPGTLINSLTGQPVPLDAEGGITFVPIKRSVNWARFNAMDKDKPGYDPSYDLGAVIWRTDNPDDARVKEQGQFGPNGEPPLATKFINYFCMVPGTMPMVISFSKTSYNAGKRLSTLTQFADGDLFAWKYRLKSHEEMNAEKQSYFVLTVETAGKCTDEEFAAAERLWEMFAKKDVKIHEEAVDGEASDGGKKPWDDPSKETIS